jgi:hypothetical protein
MADLVELERYVQLEDFKGLKKAAKRALAEDPDDPDVLLYAGIAAHKLANFDKSITLLSRVIAQRGDDCRAYANRAAAWRQQGRYDRAITDYTAAVRYDKNGFSSQHLIDRAITYRLAKQYREAIADYDTVLQHQPSLAEAYYGRARAHMRLGAIEKQLADLNKASFCDPTNETYKKELALAGQSYHQAKFGGRSGGSRKGSRVSVSAPRIRAPPSDDSSDMTSGSASGNTGFNAAASTTMPLPPPAQTSGSGSHRGPIPPHLNFSTVLGGTGLTQPDFPSPRLDLISPRPGYIPGQQQQQQPPQPMRYTPRGTPVPAGQPGMQGYGGEVRYTPRSARQHVTPRSSGSNTHPGGYHTMGGGGGGGGSGYVPMTVAQQQAAQSYTPSYPGAAPSYPGQYPPEHVPDHNVYAGSATMPAPGYPGESMPPFGGFVPAERESYHSSSNSASASAQGFSNGEIPMPVIVTPGDPASDSSSDELDVTRARVSKLNLGAPAPQDDQDYAYMPSISGKASPVSQGPDDYAVMPSRKASVAGGPLSVPDIDESTGYGVMPSTKKSSKAPTVAVTVPSPSDPDVDGYQKMPGAPAVEDVDDDDSSDSSSIGEDKEDYGDVFAVLEKQKKKKEKGTKEKGAKAKVPKKKRASTAAAVSPAVKDLTSSSGTASSRGSGKTKKPKKKVSK